MSYRTRNKEFAPGRLWLLVVLMVAALACSLAVGTQAFAAPEEDSSSTASTEAAEDATSLATAAETTTVPFGITIGNDGFIANSDVQTKNVEVAGNLFVAGDNIAVDGGTIGVDLFAAGRNVSLANFTATNNAFLAGRSIDLNNLAVPNAFAAGSNLAINGTMHSLTAVGEKILVSGTYEGNVSLTGSDIIIDPNLEVKGTLEVTAPTEPSIPSTAKIANYTFNQAEQNEQTDVFSTDFSQVGSTAWLWTLLFIFLTLLITCVLMLVFCRTENIDGLGRVLRERPWATILTGLIALIAVPLVIVLLALTLVGLQSAFALCAIALVVAAISEVITAVAIGRLIMGRINKWISSAIMIIVFALLLSLPIVMWVVSLLSVWFAFGLVIQGWWVWRRKPQIPEGASDEFGFDFPRGAHTGPSGEPTPPTPVSMNIPSSNTADYTPRQF